MAALRLLSIAVLPALAGCLPSVGGYGSGTPGFGGGLGYSSRSTPAYSERISAIQADQLRFSRCGSGGYASEASRALCFESIFPVVRQESRSEAREREKRCGRRRSNDGEC